MCQFWLFSFEDYEAIGGLCDLVGVFQTLKEAVSHATNVRHNNLIWKVTENERNLCAEHRGRCPILDKGNMTFRWDYEVSNSESYAAGSKVFA